jgi:intracellular septation protein
VKFLFDFFPLLLFFGAYKVYGIFVATAVAMAASFAQVGIHYFRHRRFEAIHLISLAVITVFGGATLLLKDKSFIMWKPTILYWIFAALVLGSQLTKGRTAMEYVLGAQLKLPPRIWKGYNLSWGIFFLVLGAINLYVAFYFRPELDAATREATWVNFKVFWLMGLTFAFAIAQSLVISRHVETPDDRKSNSSCGT